MFFSDDKFKDHSRERHPVPPTRGKGRVFRATPRFRRSHFCACLPWRAARPRSSFMIEPDDLERSLTFVRERAAGSGEGIFGPGSVTWRINREAAIFLGAGRALLLQLAHPWVATAIAEHSRTLADPIGRFHRTFSVMYTMAFGTLDQALTAARRLHRRHAAITGMLSESAGPFAAGSHYAANEVSALHWVHATLVDTALEAYTLVLPPLSDAERERYYAENRVFAALFGIPDEALPPTWQDFAAYSAAMHASGTLTVTPEARAIAEKILDGAGLWLRPPAWYRALTARMLSPRLRADFGLDYADTEHRCAESALAWIRRIYPALPHRLRYVGPYQEASGRLGGRAHPDLVTQCSNRLWIGRRSIAAGQSEHNSRRMQYSALL